MNIIPNSQQSKLKFSSWEKNIIAHIVQDNHLSECVDREWRCLNRYQNPETEHKTYSKLNIMSILKLPTYWIIKKKNKPALLINLNWNISSRHQAMKLRVLWIIIIDVKEEVCSIFCLCLHLSIALSTGKKEKNRTKIQYSNKKIACSQSSIQTSKGVTWYITHMRTRNPYQMCSQEIKHCAQKDNKCKHCLLGII